MAAPYSSINNQRETERADTTDPRTTYTMVSTSYVTCGFEVQRTPLARVETTIIRLNKIETLLTDMGHRVSMKFISVTCFQSL